MVFTEDHQHWELVVPMLVIFQLGDNLSSEYHHINVIQRKVACVRWEFRCDSNSCCPELYQTESFIITQGHHSINIGVKLL